MARPDRPERLGHGEIDSQAGLMSRPFLFPRGATSGEAVYAESIPRNPRQKTSLGWLRPLLLLQSARFRARGSETVEERHTMAALPPAGTPKEASKACGVEDI